MKVPRLPATAYSPVAGCLLTLLAATLLVLVVERPAAQQRPTSQTPTFRAGITVVPLDVCVVDGHGQPVTDLEPDDFTISEDGVVQKIVSFSLHAFDAHAPGPSPRLRSDALSFDVAPADFRVFLILLGHDALKVDWKTRESLASFVRDRLLPQDRVALMTMNRATDFTTDHESVARAIEAVGRPANRSALTPLPRQVEPVFQPSAPLTRPDAPPNDISFHDYIDAAGGAPADQEAVRYAINYLRFMEGEKHIIALSYMGLGFGTYEGVKRLAADANDARVALDIIQTGGIPSNPGPFLSGTTGSSPLAQSPGAMPQTDASVSSAERGQLIARESPLLNVPSVSPSRGPVPIPGFSASQLIGFSDNRTVSRLTGGQTFIAEYPSKALDRIDRSSRSYYLIGYSPVNANWDGRFRSIRVKVNRRGVTVLFRHGYLAREATEPLDRKKYLTENRIAAAEAHTADLEDLKVSATVSIVPPALPGSPMASAVVDLTIAASRLSFTESEGRHVASLNVAVFCGDKDESVVGQVRQTLDLNLKDARYEEAKTQGVHHRARVFVTRQPRYVKVIVYDYGSDLLGSTMVTVEPKKKR